MKSQLFDHLRRARWRIRRTQQELKHGHEKAPALFANSFPKSGTHLLTQVLSGFTKLGPFVETGLPAVTMFDGPTGAPRLNLEIWSELSQLRPGDIRYGHLHAEPEIMAALCQPGIAPFFILRDPRDVVVSHVFYVTDIESNHAHHEFYTKELHTFEERLLVSILGRPEFEYPFPNIYERMALYLGWLDCPEALTLRYEEFIQDREAALGRVFDHVTGRGFAYQGSREQAIRLLAGQIDPKKSPTFRSGKVGGWREHFSPIAQETFKQVTRDLLVRLGYEQTEDW